MKRPAAQDTAFVAAHFGTIWPVHLSAFTRLLIRLREAFDGDLELLLILAVIGDRTRPATWSGRLDSLQELTSAPGEERLQVPINLHSVAQYSGIPRETVRRKVAILQRKGWVVRHPDGRLSVSRTAGRDLAGATADSVAYLAAILAACDAARAGAPQPGQS